MPIIVALRATTGCGAAVRHRARLRRSRCRQAVQAGAAAMPDADVGGDHCRIDIEHGRRLVRDGRGASCGTLPGAWRGRCSRDTTGRGRRRNATGRRGYRNAARRSCTKRLGRRRHGRSCANGARRRRRRCGGNGRGNGRGSRLGCDRRRRGSRRGLQRLPDLGSEGESWPRPQRGRRRNVHRRRGSGRRFRGHRRHEAAQRRSMCGRIGRSGAAGSHV